MIICVCKAINERAIRRAVAEGHDTFDALQFELGVGTCCGKCVPSACAVLCAAQSAACVQQPAAVADRPVHFARHPVSRPSHHEVALA